MTLAELHRLATEALASGTDPNTEVCVGDEDNHEYVTRVISFDLRETADDDETHVMVVRTNTDPYVEINWDVEDYT
jgi:hypothetical protein